MGSFISVPLVVAGLAGMVASGLVLAHVGLPYAPLDQVLAQGNPYGDSGSVVFDLNEENASGQSGQATLTSLNDQTRVELVLSPGNLESELVHIHSGQCGASLGGVVFPLSSFGDGSGESVTVVDAPLSSLQTGDFAVNTHNKQDPSVFTACGNIPAVP
jgi:hypothetical protein